MKALILAAGYATRLYPFTKDKPKPLLTIRRKPIIEYIINKLESLNQIDQILIVTNQKFFKQFQSWRDNFPSIKPTKLINDGSTNEKDKRGAIGDIALAIKEANIEDDLLVVAGDNLFSFSLQPFIEFANKKRPQTSIGIYNLNGRSNPNKFGVVQLNGNEEITNFEEKPAQPKSSLIAMCIYFFPKENLHLIGHYLNQNGEYDAPGHYISWLTKSDKVYGYTFEGNWCDIGDIDAYTEAVFTF
jgi:glucose-1-phosphate thymidylyltransferase